MSAGSTPGSAFPLFVRKQAGDRLFAAIIYPEQQSERIIAEGVIPLLDQAFNLRPEDLPICFT
jgi:hypothetical protein